MNVSIIIPAYNAAETLGATLTSIQAQTFPHWEAIIIDDGSSDQTVAIAQEFAAKDHRISLVAQSNQGVSAARNRGIELAKFDWLLFLDADDWIKAEYLERMTKALEEDSSLDAVQCGTSRIAPDGSTMLEQYPLSLKDLFPVLALRCPLLIHSCVFRKALAQSIGGFDTSLRTSEDWDFWQRLARIGAKFGSVQEIMAFYRMRPNSLSRDVNYIFADALKVITQGHSPDPRVDNPHPNYAQGQPKDTLSKYKLLLSAWFAGFCLSQGKDARPLLELLVNDQDPNLSSQPLAHRLFQSVLVATCQQPPAWTTLWPTLEESIRDFLQALENQSQTIGLTHSTMAILERKVLQQTQITAPQQVGKTFAISLEVTEPFYDLDCPDAAERLYAVVTMEGTELGTIELPIWDKQVSAWLIKDAVAASFAWPILKRFFEHQGHFQTTQIPKAEPQNHSPLPKLPNKQEWELFLQEICLVPETATNPPKRSEDGSITLEISEELADIQVSVPELDVVLTVGGVALSCVSIPVENNFISAADLRAALSLSNGFELCRACVREGLLGKPLHTSSSLRARLAESAQKIQSTQWLGFSGSGAIEQLLTANTIVLGRRGGLEGGYRRAILPASVAQELLEMSQVSREPVIQLPGPNQQPERVIYAPELMIRPYKGENLLKSFSSPGVQTAFYGRAFFETLFSTQPDPWKYTTPYEQTKYEQTLSLLPSTEINQALEIACAEGHFTLQLAPRVHHLIAADISQVALNRTAERCSDLNNISFVQLDIIKDPLPGLFDLIVCSEVLYLLDNLEQLQTATSKIALALKPGGYILTANAHLIVDEPEQPGFKWGNPFGGKVISETFAKIPTLSLVKEIWTPLYRVQLFQRQPEGMLAEHQTPELIKLTEQPTALSPEQEAYVCWNGGQLKGNPTSQSVITRKLPILMYHRVAPTGSPQMSQYRVTPEAFEEQLRYLKDGGFYSVAWEDWQLAMISQTPLPGRALALTFDDGYLDFFEYAWPLLKKYGFTATVFLVSERIGYDNSWDATYGEKIALMGWREIQQLADQGVVFGSHSATHPSLIRLSYSSVIAQASRSRMLLERQLGIPIKTFAYPYGDYNPIVQHLIEACGYSIGLSCDSRLSQFEDNLLALPRLEVMGSDSLQDFVVKLSFTAKKN
ncbi:trifunctional glycosyltransferase/class I SAM-dependent methyltransferase/polysaccharide deacetylase [Gloeothece verrucosa]|uniref:Glycosyl transferase family 2 n=1 Tax=Gloeothece verrucosa (strain PCC 7822) TaxID=497965 RepID=E0UKX6_GLOV7|nr:trifunctional glycosyltransferase/class I SAM-dependent methyltransferase/polysaccharide deacetylase [Gloeothece verrucosa]ADN17606.1 glycosyl transferase family 2 [Gloeothece verrucosa PCC 7822]